MGPRETVSVSYTQMGPILHYDPSRALNFFNQKMAIFINLLRNGNGIAFFIGNRFEMLVGGSVGLRWKVHSANSKST
jgi:hypothetical protein